MSLAINLTSLTPATPEKLVVHTGAMYRNINLEELEGAGGGFADAVNPENTWVKDGRTMTPQPFGATRGGFTIEPGLEITPIDDIDGTLGPTEGLVEVTGFAPTFAGQVVEMADYRKFKEALGAADAQLMPSGLWKISPRSFVDKTDHLGNLAIFCQTTNSSTSQYWVVVLLNPLGGTTSHQLQRGTNALPITYRGYAALESPYDPPIRYYIPQVTGDGSGS